MSDHDPVCMVQDEVLMGIAEKVKNFAVIYCVDIDEVRIYIYVDITIIFCVHGESDEEYSC